MADAEASQASICAAGSAVSLKSPQSSTSGAGTAIDGFCVSGITVIVCVRYVVLLHASFAVQVTVMVYVAGAQMFSCDVALVLNVLWIPVIDQLTQGRYGAVNSLTILLLSASMPLLYYNNFLWTVNFAKGRLKMIFYVFFISFLFNLAGDISLIPFFNAEGAAVGYLIAIAAQSVIYLSQTPLKGLKQKSYPVLLCPAAALLRGFSATMLFTPAWLILLSSLCIFLILLYFTRQISVTDLLVLKRIAGI